VSEKLFLAMLLVMYLTKGALILHPLLNIRDSTLPGPIAIAVPTPGMVASFRKPVAYRLRYGRTRKVLLPKLQRRGAGSRSEMPLTAKIMDGQSRT